MSRWAKARGAEGGVSAVLVILASAGLLAPAWAQSSNPNDPKPGFPGTAPIPTSPMPTTPLPGSPMPAQPIAPRPLNPTPMPTTPPSVTPSQPRPISLPSTPIDLRPRPVELPQVNPMPGSTPRVEFPGIGTRPVNAPPTTLPKVDMPGTVVTLPAFWTSGWRWWTPVPIASGSRDGAFLPETGPNADAIRIRNERLKTVLDWRDRRQWWVGPYGWVITSNGFAWNAWCGYGFRDWYESPRPLVGGYDASEARPVWQPATQEPAPPPRSLTERERADGLLRAGEVGAAIEQYKRALAVDEGDAQARRMLGVALVIQGKTRDGIAVVHAAYRQDPRLVDRPIDIDLLPRRETSVREATQRVVVEANRWGSASAWLAGAALAQADGRKPTALRMARQAKELGLDSKIADRLLEVLER